MKQIFSPPLRKNDDIFLRAAEGALPFVRVYEQDVVEIVHGPSCRNARDEVFVDRCSDDGVMISERRGGGGTVVLSPGVLVVLVVGRKISARENAVDVFRRIHDKLIEILDNVGVKGVEHAGISDLAVGGKKILGSSLYMGSQPPLFYYQSSLMVSNDVSLMDKYLRHPPREPDYRQGRSHSEFCTTLRDLGYRVDIRELSVEIESELKNFFMEVGLRPTFVGGNAPATPHSDQSQLRIRI